MVVSQMEGVEPGLYQYNVIEQSLELVDDDAPAERVMVATALGLAPFETAAIKDVEVEQLLGIDGMAETVLYCMGAGLPCVGSFGSPVDAAPQAGIEAWRRTSWQG